MPGAAELIFKTYENEVAHRQATEKEMLRIEAAASKSSSSIMIMGIFRGHNTDYCNFA